MPMPSPPPSADEREFDAFAQEQDAVDIAAATWATRRRGGLSADQEAALQAWLAADPRHGPALDEMEATFGDLQRLPGDDVARLRHALPPQAAPVLMAAPAKRGGALRPRGWVSLLPPRLPQAGAAAAVLALVAGGWLGWGHWQRQPVFDQAYATERGQLLQAGLPDGTGSAPGSLLQLDTASRAHVTLYRDRREVRLQDGQAMFSVARDPQRPFHVDAGPLRITVLGTRFSVRHTATGLEAGSTVVAVEEGRVRVARRDAAAGPDTRTPPLELVTGQRVVADAQGHWGAVAPLDGQAVAVWREGRLAFDQTPLAQAIAEFERYGRTGLRVHDPAVARLPVGGSYSVQQWQRFAETLPLVLPVRLVRRGDFTEVVAR